jgi:hypothetical protein
MLLSPCLLLALAVGEPVAAPPADPDVAVDTQRAKIDTLVVRVDGLDFGRLEEAIGLRAPELRIDNVDREGFEAPTDPLFAYALAHPKEGQSDSWNVTVILSDGRAFFRTVVADPQTAPRVLATTLVNLVRSGEAGTTAPDATRQLPDLPRAEPAAVPDPPVTEEPPPSGLDVGVGLQGALVTGFGPPSDADLIVGGAGGLEVGLRLPQGVVVLVGGRVTSRTEDAHRMLRIQTALSAGYAWRRREFEVLALGFIAVEPWFVRGSGHAEGVSVAETSDHYSPVLLGGGARVSPGYRASLRDGHSIHLGIRVDIGGSAMPRGGVGRVTARNAAGDLDPLFRLGGLELATGIEVIAWFGTHRRGSPRREAR